MVTHPPTCARTFATRLCVLVVVHLLALASAVVIVLRAPVPMQVRSLLTSDTVSSTTGPTPGGLPPSPSGLALTSSTLWMRCDGSTIAGYSIPIPPETAPQIIHVTSPTTGFLSPSAMARRTTTTSGMLHGCSIYLAGDIGSVLRLTVGGSVALN